MPWISLSPNDLYPYLAAEQADALRTSALAAGQADPVPGLIADTVALVRAQVAAHAANRLSQTPGTIPPELRGSALALVIEAAQTRLPGLELSDDQVRAANQARTLLQRVATGRVAITVPADPIPADEATTPVAPVAVQVLGSRARPLTSRSLSGL